LFLLVLDGILHRALDGKKRGITWRLKESPEKWNMRTIYVIYPIDSNTCKGNWMISGRNLSRSCNHFFEDGGNMPQYNSKPRP
jgi:hypothetical protein